MDLTKLRRATSVAQTVLKESTPALIIDGKPGTFTTQAYNNAPSALRNEVDALVVAMGFPGGYKTLNDTYSKEKSVAVAKNDPKSIFDLQVVPALVRATRSRGLNPLAVVTHVSLETGYGAKTPVAEDGSPSFNYGGIKWNSVKTPRKAFAKTTEYIGGVKTSLTDAFAVFDNGDQFAQAYITYLLDGPSSYRYKGLKTAKTPYEFGAVLQAGGYATDPQYADKFARTSDSVARRYDLV